MPCSMTPMYKRILIASLVALLNACGGGNGGDNQQVTEVQARTLAYGLDAVVYVAGHPVTVLQRHGHWAKGVPIVR